MQFASLIVFSRLLSPSQLGIVSMVTAVTSVAAVVGDFGLSLAAVQAKELSQAQKSNLFWTNAGLGTAIAGMLVLIAPLVSAFYHEPAAKPVTAMLALVFMFNGLAVQFRTQLNRDSRFVALAVADGGSQLVGFVIGLILALTGFGYWSMVYMQVLVAACGLAIVAITARWFPGLPRRGTRMGTLYSYGAYTFFTQVLNYISSNIDTIMIGRLWGSASVGLYSRAYQIAFQPTLQIASPLTRIFLPLLARGQEQENTVSYHDVVRRTQTTFMYVILGILSLVVGAAPSLIPLVLGTKWSPAVPLVSLLAIAGAFQSAGYIYYWLMLASARTKPLFMAELGARVVMVALIVILAFSGSIWVAASVALGQLLNSAALTVVGGAGPLDRLDLLRATLRPFATYALAAGVAVVVCHAASGLAPGLAVESVIAICTWLLTFVIAARVVPSVKRDIAEVIAYGKSAVRAQA